MRFEHRLHTNAGERLIGTVFGNLEIFYSSTSIDNKAQTQGSDVDQITLLVDVSIPPRTDRIGHDFLVTAERRAQGIYRRDSAVGNVPRDVSSLFLVTIRRLRLR